MRQLSDIITSLADYIKDNNPSINSTQEGKVVKDVVVDSPAQEFSKSYVASDYNGSLCSVSLLKEILASSTYQLQLQEALNMTEEEVTAELKRACDDLASNYNITRRAASKATGTVRFYRTDSGTMNIPLATTVTTKDTIPIVFQTTEAVSGSAIFDPDTSMYYLDASIEAQVAGVSGNVMEGTIQLIVPSIADAIYCNNLVKTAGGLDEQTNEELLDVVQLAWMGRNLNTSAGYKKYFLQQSGVSDVLVVDASSTLMTRVDGGVDIYYIAGGEQLVGIDTRQYLGGNREMVMSKQPVDSVVSVVGSRTYVEGVDFDFIQDTGAYSGSVLGQDKIKFRVGYEPTLYESITTTYLYDSQVASMQNLLAADYEDGSNYVVDSNILLKRGVRVLVDHTFKLVVLSGYDPTVVQAAVTNAIQDWYDAKIFDENIYQSDFIALVEGVTGVDRIDLPMTKMARHGGTGVSDIILEEYEYARLGDLTYL